jgi:archaellum component FlaC
LIVDSEIKQLKRPSPKLGEARDASSTSWKYVEVFVWRKQMTQANDNTAERLGAFETRLDRIEELFANQTSAMMEGLRELSQQTISLANRVDQLTGRVDQLTGTVEVLAREGAADRAVMREMQTEIRQIWQYLESQQRSRGNGQG